MPPRPDNLGERLSGVEATLAAFEKYERERWHKLDNDLTPVVNLPEKLTREIGRLQGIVDGKISTVTRDLERAITFAIERAIEPINGEITALRSDVDQLKAARAQMSGARAFAVWLAQTLIAAVSAVVAVLAFGRQG